MAMRTDPARLTAELVAAGIPATAFAGCRSGGPLDTIAWATGHPTPTEQMSAAAVLAAHDPDSTEKDDVAERRRVRDLEAVMADATTPLPQWRAAVTAHAKIVARRTGANSE